MEAPLEDAILQPPWRFLRGRVVVGRRPWAVPIGSVAIFRQRAGKMADVPPPSISGLLKWRQFEPEVILLAVGWTRRPPSNGARVKSNNNSCVIMSLIVAAN
jgi:hypothetical protein